MAAALPGVGHGGQAGEPHLIGVKDGHFPALLGLVQGRQALLASGEGDGGTCAFKERRVRFQL
ncbi:hypothetical protein [Hymenobacter sp. BRD67]|uniref:hypothetical protein n=1 Tax=Hymenobacter sp. BRD67 TaxID=2675877 RepID=UPI0015660781|nr:hypothetical protein [Hymenobacter sp. BRD67]QKG53479.1 hypothetical protein GKZ67_13840 [Hymenobacter sp. BRD67]